MKLINPKGRTVDVPDELAEELLTKGFKEAKEVKVASKKSK